VPHNKPKTIAVSSACASESS